MLLDVDAGCGRRGAGPAAAVQAAHQGRARAGRVVGRRAAGPGAGDLGVGRAVGAVRCRRAGRGSTASTSSARRRHRRARPARRRTPRRSRRSASRRACRRWAPRSPTDTIPAELGQWLIDASVSFTKGCYTGQELVARIDSRGGNVPRPLRGLVVDGAVPAVGADGGARRQERRRRHVVRVVGLALGRSRSHPWRAPSRLVPPSRLASRRCPPS